MRIDALTGRLSDCTWLPSPNYDARPDANDISLLVIHAISLPAGCFGTPDIDALFTNTLDCQQREDYACLEGLRVSAHALIRRDGSVTQYVPFHERAWHAGVSEFAGRPRCNDFSIGIELEGCDDQPFEAVQYDTLAALTSTLMEQYPAITDDRICGHSDIAPGRKTDPGPHFDWSQYRSLCGFS